MDVGEERKGVEEERDVGRREEGGRFFCEVLNFRFNLFNGIRLFCFLLVLVSCVFRSIVMTRSWNIVMTRILENCDDMGHGAL